MPRAAFFLLSLWIWAANDPSLTQVQQHGKAGLWLRRLASDPLSVKLSETLTIVMRVDGDTPLEVELTQKVRSAEGWHLATQGDATTVKLDDGQRTRWEQVFLATPLKPGEFPLKLPALEFTEKTSPKQTVAWDPLLLKITTRVAKVDPTEARDRIGIEEVPPSPPVPPPPWWPWLLPVLPLGAALAFVAWRWRCRPGQSPAPGEAALKDLDELSRLPVDTPEQAKGYFFRLSDVLRRYLELRLGLPATQRTTAEFFAGLAKASPFDPQRQQTLGEVLRICDLAKFAGIMPASGKTLEVVESARVFVKQTEADLTAKVVKGRK